MSGSFDRSAAETLAISLIPCRLRSPAEPSSLAYSLAPADSSRRLCLRAALAASGTEMVTVAIRTTGVDGSGPDAGILSAIDLG